MIRFNCSCGREFTVTDDKAGKKGKCPVCGVVVVIPRVDPDLPIDLDAPIAQPPIVPSNPKPRRKLDLSRFKPMISRRLVIAYLLGVGSGLTSWLIWPEPDYARFIKGNSPQYMLAALDMQKVIDDRDERVEFYAFFLNKSQEYYVDRPREVAWDIADTVADLNHDGFPSEAMSLLLDAVNCGEKAKVRDGAKWEPIKIRSFCYIYDYFRREHKLNHRDAIKRINEFEKI